MIRRSATALGVALVALLAAAGPAAADSGATSAPGITQGITQVAVSPVRAPVDAPLNVAVSFCVPHGAQPGSQITLTIPDSLTPMTTGFLLLNSARQFIAVGTVNQQAVTVTVGPFIDSESQLCGHVTFPALINTDRVIVNSPDTLQFRTVDSSYDVAFTPTETTGAKADEPITYGIWTNPADQGRTHRTGALTWYLESGRAPSPDGNESVTFVDTPQAGQAIACRSPRVEIGRLDHYNHFVFVQSYTGSLSTACSANRVSVTMGSLASGTVARLVLQATPAMKAPSSFGNVGTVATDGGDARAVISNRVVHYVASGTVTGKAGITVATAQPAPAASTPTAPSRSATHPVTTQSASAGPGSSAVALLVGLVAVGAAMIGLALRRRKPAEES